MVLEAMAHGLPTVCLDLGGPAVIVNHSCGRVIRTRGKTETEVTEALGDALAELAADVHLRAWLKEGALARCRKYQWSKVVRRLYTGADE